MVFKIPMINRCAMVLAGVILIAGASLAIAQEARTAPPSPPQKAKQKVKPEKAPGASSKSGEEDDQVRGEPVTVKLPRGGKVTISSRSGHIVVSGWDKDVVEATAIGTRGPAQ